MKTKSFIPAIFAALLLASLHSVAFAAPPAGAVELKSIAEQDVTVTENGKQVSKRQPVKKAVPGDEVIYTTTFRNLISKPVGDIAVTNPLPNNTTYVAGSAFGENSVITFSVDGGKTFAAPGALKVKGADGALRAALPADYTHIRWVYQGALAVGKTGSVGFHARIN